MGAADLKALQIELNAPQIELNALQIELKAPQFLAIALRLRLTDAQRVASVRLREPIGAPGRRGSTRCIRRSSEMTTRYGEDVSGRRAWLCYTDGSCKAGEGAPGGWGFVLKPPTGMALEAYGKARGTLAKVMEYQAVAEALEALPEGATAIVFSDNQSLVANLAAGRAASLAKSDPEVAASAGRIDANLRERRLLVTFQWVRSHNGNAGNERADALAAQGAREARADLLAKGARRR